MNVPRHPTRRGALLVLLLAATAVPVDAEAQDPPSAEAPALDVRVETDEADAVLAILARRRAGEAVREEEWARLLASEGYRRLAERERGMGRDFADSTFRAFVLSDSLLAREAELRRTLEAWRRIDATAAARRAFAYLPAGAALRATIYPSIKPQGNSFVWDVRGDPAIFLYLDPEVGAAEFENTLAHELHHVGYAGACSDEDEDDDGEEAPEPVRTARLWLGAFGEGVAMLAAAGGPDVHPHAASDAEDRERWDRDVAAFDRDLAAVQAFLLDVLDGRLTGDAVTERAREFYGVQGPWYTVGWRMAETVERVQGREALVATLCDPPALLAAFNRAAEERADAGGPTLARWSPELLERLGAPE